MSAIVCTLFEGNYHYGVAALVNSLYNCGFKGSVYAGYRGELPLWTSSAVADNSIYWQDATILKVNDDLKIYFLPLITTYHLTNYKPDFMLRLLESAIEKTDSIFYFDPDIVLTAPWNFILEWVDCGIAVCEDIKSPLEKYHPRRVGWRKYYKEFDFQLNFKNAAYVNGGFVGLKSSQKEFLNTWKALQECMSKHIGGLEKSSITAHSQLSDEISVLYSPFGATDQDALNATIEACDFEVSYMHKEAMSLDKGSPVLMPHALGSPKPWNYYPFQSCIRGKAPRFVDKQFWSSVEYPIKVYPKSKIFYMKFSIKVVSFINRFYSK